MLLTSIFSTNPNRLDFFQTLIFVPLNFWQNEPQLFHDVNDEVVDADVVVVVDVDVDIDVKVLPLSVVLR